MANQELPQELISDVLCHLPVKSLLRFRSLSKSYFFEIMSPQFIKRHYTKSLQTNTNLSLLITEVCKQDSRIVVGDITFMDFDSLKNPVTLRNALEKVKLLQQESRFVGSCNGLLCLSTSHGNIALLNFSTRKCRFLSPPKQEEFTNGDHAWGYSFAYDNSTDDYYVIRITQTAGLGLLIDGRLIRSEVLVYTLRTNAWKKVNKDFPFTFDLKRGVYVSAMLHFIFAPISQFRTPWKDRTYMIVAFTPDFNNYTELPLPDCLVKGYVYFNLSILGGCLCVSPIGIGPRGYSTNSVWLMKEYGVKESWMQIISFSNGLEGMWTPVAYSLKEDKVLWLANDNTYQWYDLTEKQMNKIETEKPLPKLSIGVVSVGSLVSLE
ncbi:hypothetical protein ACFE04_030395 [Oxalis oulophora]